MRFTPRRDCLSPIIIQDLVLQEAMRAHICSLPLRTLQLLYGTSILVNKWAQKLPRGPLVHRSSACVLSIDIRSSIPDPPWELCIVGTSAKHASCPQYNFMMTLLQRWLISLPRMPSLLRVMTKPLKFLTFPPGLSYL